MILLIQNTSLLSASLVQQEINPPNLLQTSIPSTTDPGEGVVLSDDKFVRVNNGVTSWTDYTFEPENLEDDITLTNITPSLYTLSGSRTNRLSSGYGKLQSQLGSVKKIYTFSTVSITNGNYRRFISFSAGSLAKYLEDQIVNKLPNKQQGYYSTVDHVANTYTRNISCWASDIDLSGVALATDRLGHDTWTTSPRGTLITPRHMLGAKHYNIYYPSYEAAAGYVIGTKVKFADLSGNAYERYVIGRSYWEDVVVATLDEELPPSVKPVDICGDWIVRAPLSGTSTQVNYSATAFYLDRLYNCNLIYLGDPLETYSAKLTAAYTVNGNVYNAYYSMFAVPTATFNGLTYCALSGYGSFYKQGSGGDSGSPIMVLSGTNPMLLFTWLGATNGPPLFNSNGALVQDLVRVADQDAVSRGWLDEPTNLLINVSPVPDYL